MKNENNNPRKSNIIGICVSQLQNHEVSGLTHTIYQCARANGYQVRCLAALPRWISRHRIPMVRHPFLRIFR